MNWCEILFRPVRVDHLSWLDRMFGIDLRALGLFRIGLALLLLYDLASRAFELEAHYTDFGTLPRANLTGTLTHPWLVISLHTLSGALSYEAALFILAGIFAGMLLIGWQTRVAHVASWIMLVSLHARNPVILQGGDLLLRTLLFWSMFLPLGAIWSLDARRLARTSPAHIPPRRVLSFATAAMLLQVAMMYVCSGFMKSDPIWERDGTAIFYALSLDAFTTAIGTSLLEYREFLKWLTFGTLYLERFGPWLAFIPVRGPWLRTLVVIAFWGLHLGLIATMQLGPFPYICLVAWLIFVPSEIWDILASWLQKCGAIQRGQDSLLRSMSPDPFVTTESKVRLGRLADALIAILLAVTVLWNVRIVWRKEMWGLTEEIEPLVVALRLDQAWGMFAPYPLKSDGWWVMTGTLADGSQVNLWNPAEPVTDDKSDQRHFYPGERWRKYFFNLWDREYSAYRRACAAWLVRRWNRDHTNEPARQCTHAQLKFWVEETSVDAFPPLEEKILVEYDPAVK